MFNQLQPGLRLLGVFILLFISLLATRLAAAHTEVESGSYILEIGWVNEPVLVGQPNGLFLYIKPAEEGEEAETEEEHTEDEHGHQEGVTGAEATLSFTVEYGGVSRKYELEPVLDQPGNYTAGFIPTREGQYTFHFTGTIDDETVDVSFEPEEVEAAGERAFPEAVVSPAEQADQLDAAQAQARTALLVGEAGLVLGLVGAGLGVYSLTRRR